MASEDHARRHAAFETVLSDPAIRRAREAIEREEARLGRELSPRFQVLQDRHDAATRGGDFGNISRMCPGKHGRYGRICVLDAGHETTDPRGVNSSGQPIAWVGNAPDDV